MRQENFLPHFLLAYFCPMSGTLDLRDAKDKEPVLLL